MARYPEDVEQRLESALADILGLAQERVEYERGMGQDIGVPDDEARDAARRVWSKHLAGTWAPTHGGLSMDDVAGTAFGIGVLVGWRAAESAERNDG